MVTADLDVIVGPWNPRKKSGTHNMLFFHRGRFRSNTLGNLNAYGPSANTVKAQQNIDLPAHSYTQFKGGQVLTLGHTYHITHIYDAASKIVTFIISENGHVLKSGALRRHRPGAASSRCRRPAWWPSSATTTGRRSRRSAASAGRSPTSAS